MRQQPAAASVALDVLQRSRGPDRPCLAPQLDEPAQDRGARLGVQHLEGQILELLADVLHAHPPGQGRIDLHGLARDPFAFLGPQVRRCVRMLCSRSASFTRITRTSLAIASRSLRKFSAWAVSLEDQFQLRVSLVTPSTSVGDLGAEQALGNLGVRSPRCPRCVSCRQRRDDRGIVKPQIDVRIAATSSGWPK